MSDETGWLIERYLSSQLVYWHGSDGNTWDSDASNAVRFARRTDAERMLEWHCNGIGRVAEHMWCALPDTKDQSNG